MEKKERCKKCADDYLKALQKLEEYERKLADGELVSKDWHDEQVLHLQEENERLTEELEIEKHNHKATQWHFDNSYKEGVRLLEANKELQKQVDELTDHLSEKQNALWDLQDDFDNLLDEGKKQAVKDEAKETYGWLKEHTFGGAGWELVKTYFREKGVEVE